ncbi:hypothetical protein EDD11_009467 [Mortierella claussenii]|nr:hypothetical protein EDD11_009467 [Mortierella claussenii]
MQQHQPHHSRDPELSSSPPRSAFSSSHVVDIDAIELEKENIQPIRQGRSAQVLSRLFSTQHDDRAHELALQHQRFQLELEHIDDHKDPMDIFMRYVSWTIENYPQGGGQGLDSRLVSLLEQAIELFKDEERYRNDPRFVKLFILYSENIEFPMDVFNFMDTNRIGSEISMYYEEHADYLESQEEYDKAKEVFLLGIHRRARPFGRLKRLFEEFERRAELHQQELEKQALEDSLSSTVPPRQRPFTVSATPALTANRRILGTKMSGSESRHANETLQGHVPIGSSSSFSSSLHAPRLSATAPSSYQQPNARLQVFSDQGAHISSGQLRKSQNIQSMKGGTSWKDLGADQVRRKENLLEPTPWKGTRLTAEDSLARRPHPKLQVYRDPENVVPEPSSASTVSIQPSSEKPSRLNQFMPIVQESPTTLPINNENLSIRPTGLVVAQSTSACAPQQLLKEPREQFPILTNERGKLERLMIDLNQIYVDKEEFSIEEIRARRKQLASSLHADTGHWSSTKPQSDTLSYTERQHFDEGRTNIPRAPPAPEHRSFQSARADQLPTTITVRPLLPESPSDEGREIFSFKRRHAASSPTLHTKYASEEMNKLFSDRSRSRRSMDSQWSTEDSHDVDDDELNKFTMAYSIPTTSWPLSPSSREFLENEIQNEYEDDDDDDQDTEGRTEGLVKRLEQGFESTITQDIEALKRKRAEEEGSNRLSFGKNKRNSYRFDSSRRQSDITMAIQQRAQKMLQQQQRQQETSESTVTNSRSILGPSRLSSGSYTSRRHNEQETIDHPANPPSIRSQTRPFQIFQDDAEYLDSELNVPMLEDEAPPPFLNHEEPL